MSENILSDIISSGAVSGFFYGGEYIPLVPSEMEKDDGNVYGICIGGLAVTLELTEADSGAYTQLLRFKNTGDENTLRISGAGSLDLNFPRELGEAVNWNSLSGDSCGAQSFLPVYREMYSGDRLHCEPEGGRSSAVTAFPYFDIHCGDLSFICAIGWTGQWSEDIAVYDDRINIRIGLCDCDFFLYPGEEVRLPSVLYMTGSDTESLRLSFRSLQRRLFSPARFLGEDFELPVAVQPYDRYFYGRRPDWPTVAGQIRTIESAARCRYFNTAWLDAAWFREGFPDGVGNYTFADGFPDGLKSVSDAAHKNGMKFMLWFEPERIHKNSDMYRDHPEFLLYRENESSALYNLGDDEALGFLTKLLTGFIRDNGIDIYRQDFNISPLPFWRRADTDGRRGIHEMKYINGLYHLWDSLLSTFPGLLIDNCSSGGRRIDFETCRRSVPLWRSDTGCAPESPTHRTQTWNQNQTISLNRYLAYQACASWSYKAYDMRAVGSEGIACNFDFLSDDFDAAEAAKPLEELVKLRGYRSGDFYSLTEPSLAENCWAAYGFVKDGNGVLYAFRREGSAESEAVFPVKCLPDEDYTVTITDENFIPSSFMISGKKLAEGLRIFITNPRESITAEYKINR